MTDNWNANGPIVAWTDYGHDGWKPRSYPTLVEAIQRSDPGTVYTVLVDLTKQVVEP